MANVDYILKFSEQFCKIAKYFDLEEFGSLPTGIENGRLSPQRHEMLSQLPISGIGGSRNTYILNSKKALKVAKTPRGLEGNKIEFENLKKYDSVWLPKVFDRANDYSWIEVEYAAPLKDQSEIENLINIDSDLFLSLVSIRHYVKSFNEAIKSKIEMLRIQEKSTFKSNDFLVNKLLEYIDNHYFAELDEIIKTMKLDSTEFREIENLGRSASGHLVLLDIGEQKYEYE